MTWHGNEARAGGGTEGKPTVSAWADGVPAFDAATTRIAAQRPASARSGPKPFRHHAIRRKRSLRRSVHGGRCGFSWQLI